MSVAGPSPSLSVVVLTFNEGRNLAACLASVAPCAADVFIVDSGSTDATARIAEQAGATFVTHAFETHARQWAWALKELPLRTDWVLALDADQRATPELAQAIVAELGGSRAASHAGYFIPRRQIFRGRWIRHGGYYPKYLLKLFRRDAVSLDESDLVDHHFRIRGQAGTLRADLIEDNLNEAAIFDWIAKHNRYARLQAVEELQRQRGAVDGRLLGTPDERATRLKAMWRRLPLYLRPVAYFLYRYIFRLGFLDGKEGFVFHVLQAFWYRLLVDINVDELRRAAAVSPAPLADADRAARKGTVP
jgi:glycosyltransferase involved in cell wall biosynthesis